MDNLEKIITENSGLIYSIITKYFKDYIYKEDLYQAGCIGFIKAYKNYKNDSNCKFTTYAYTSIYGEMYRLVNEDRAMKVSRDITRLKSKIEKVRILLSQKMMKEPTNYEIALYLNIDPMLVDEAVSSSYQIKSLDSSFSNDNSYTLLDVIGESNNIDDLLILKEKMSKLNDIDRQIVINRYMNDYTQSETSSLLGITQVQVSRREKKIKEKLKV